MKSVDELCKEYEAKNGKVIDKFTKLELLKLQDEIRELRKDINQLFEEISLPKIFIKDSK